MDIVKALADLQASHGQNPMSILAGMDLALSLLADSNADPCEMESLVKKAAEIIRNQ